ncbi:MAG: peptidase M23 [Saprospiraceae bacterium]
MYKFTILISSFFFLFTSCKSPEKKVEAAKEEVRDASKDLAEAKEEYHRQYNAFILETNQRITDYDNSIAELKRDANKVKRDLREEYNRSIVKLEQKNNELREKAKNYKEDTKEKWDSFKSEFNHDMDELGMALKDMTKNNVK